MKGVLAEGQLGWTIHKENIVKEITMRVRTFSGIVSKPERYRKTRVKKKVRLGRDGIEKKKNFLYRLVY